MRILRRQLIYVQVHQDHFIARVVGGDRTIRRKCHALANRAGAIKDFSILRAQLKEIFSELTPGFSLQKPWALLHFDPVEYSVTKEELAGFQKAAMQSGVSFCFLSTWEQRHEDKDLLEMFK
ncbi:hypothetical protein K1516_20450 [Stenotrophomonas maltophilia]|uniref:hypothetical protein n=1 Tax=Stenotrophomonas maltophilia TaxID=40324 RepID=UPI0013DBAC92|nr:hypothetical protein [Stenotrophomonas maltophilia]UQA70268.1 hypothetical protein K1516_20450 [Stenotrophomonas maltophilia]